jgi:CRISPR/Cas system type I-B associated protein Csh2 (Cas7 group RAMP superfamily)
VTIEFEILKMSWYEHSKKLDELSKLYSPEHPRVLEIQKELEKIKVQLDAERKKK